MSIAVKFLSSTLTAKFIARLLQTSENMEVPTQYFVAHEIFMDLTAIITHGKANQPDIMLSDEAIVDMLLPENQKYKQQIEVKFITWAYKNFYDAITAAIKRKQTRYLLIVLSPTLRLQHMQNTTFNKLNEGILSVIVIIMDTVEAKPQELWQEIQNKVNEQLDEDERIVAFPRDIYNAYMFQKTKEQDDKLEIMKQDQQEIKQELQKMQQEIKQELQKMQQETSKIQALDEKIDLVFKLLKEKL